MYMNKQKQLEDCTQDELLIKLLEDTHIKFEKLINYISFNDLKNKLNKNEMINKISLNLEYLQATLNINQEDADLKLCFERIYNIYGYLINSIFKIGLEIDKQECKESAKKELIKCFDVYKTIESIFKEDYENK